MSHTSWSSWTARRVNHRSSGRWSREGAPGVGVAGELAGDAEQGCGGEGTEDGGRHDGGLLIDQGGRNEHRAGCLAA